MRELRAMKEALRKWMHYDDDHDDDYYLERAVAMKRATEYWRRREMQGDEEGTLSLSSMHGHLTATAAVGVASAASLGVREALYKWMHHDDDHDDDYYLERAVTMMRATAYWRRRELGRRLIQFIVSVGWDPESSGEEERMSDERGNVEDLGPLLFDSEFYNERSPREDTSATPEAGTRPGGGGIHATRPGGGGIRSDTEGVSCHDDSEDDAEWTAPGEE